MSLPKVLVSAPTASAKNYCFHDWIENIMNFTYPNFEIRLFDNTDDGGRNAKYLNSEFDKMFSGNQRFNAQQSKIKGIKSVIEKMAISHNDCRSYAINNSFEHWLHLETDIMPPKNAIEELLSHQKQVVGALYDRDEGRWRKPMLQRHVYSSPYNISAVNFEAGEEVFFVDGTLKKAASVGLGCVMIHSSVFKKIPFRFERGVDCHPDSFFSEDCFKNKIPIYADTSICCEHNNKAWGVYGVDFK